MKGARSVPWPNHDSLDSVSISIGFAEIDLPRRNLDRTSLDEKGSKMFCKHIHEMRDLKLLLTLLRRVARADTNTRARRLSKFRCKAKYVS